MRPRKKGETEVIDFVAIWEERQKDSDESKEYREYLRNYLRKWIIGIVSLACLLTSYLLLISILGD